MHILLCLLLLLVSFFFLQFGPLRFVQVYYLSPGSAISPFQPKMIGASHPILPGYLVPVMAAFRTRATRLVEFYIHLMQGPQTTCEATF